jgi:drug/metabolite transporter (DMT)-like permease
MTSTASKPSHYLGLGLGLCAVSTASIIIRYAQADGAPSLVIAAWRLTLASLILLPVVIWRHRDELRALTPRAWGLAVISGVFLGVHFATWISSLAYTTVASSVVIVSSSPLFVALISAAILREWPARPVMAGLTIALVGIVVIGAADLCQPHGCPVLADLGRGPAFLGNMLALAGAVALAGYYSLGRALRMGQAGRSPLSLITYIFITYGAACLTLMAAAGVARLPITGYVPRVWLWFSLLAVVPQLLGHSSFNWALRYLPATYVSVAALGEPIGSTLLAIFLLGEIPSPLKIAGGALILAGILVASRRPNLPTATAQPTSK